LPLLFVFLLTLQPPPRSTLFPYTTLFRSGVYHNTAVVIDADGSMLGLYRKMHIPDDPLYYEKFYFTPGDLGFRAWQTRYGNIGVDRKSTRLNSVTFRSRMPSSA